MGEDHLSQHLSTARVDSISFYLEEFAGSSDTFGKSPLEVKKDLLKLSSLIRQGTLVPSAVGRHMGECIKKLGATEADMQAAREAAVKAADSLRPFLDHLRFCDWWISLDVDQIKKYLDGMGINPKNPEQSVTDHAADPAHPSPEQSLIGLLDQGTALANGGTGGCRLNDDADFLQKIKGCALKVIDFVKAAENTAASAKLTGMLGRLAQGVDAGLPAASRKTKWDDVDNLLELLTKYSGDRKVRPYELFLFAAQERLLKDKLVTKQSNLAPGFIPNPRCTCSSSILGTHEGYEAV